MGEGQLPGDLDAAFVGKPNVDQHDVGMQTFDHGEGRLGVIGLSHHDNVAGRLEDLARAGPEDLVVVDDQDSKGLVARARIPPRRTLAHLENDSRGPARLLRE